MQRLTENEIKVILAMMGRAQCSGQESIAVATVLTKLQGMLNDDSKTAREQNPGGASEEYLASEPDDDN